MKIPYKKLLAGMIVTTETGRHAVLAGTEEMNEYLSTHHFSHHRAAQGILICKPEFYDTYKHLGVYDKYFQLQESGMVSYNHVTNVELDNKILKNVLRRD